MMARLLALLIVVASCVWSCATGQKLVEDRPDWSVTRGS